MKVVIAPDSFKESLSAAEVASAIAEGVLEVCPSAVVDICPMADGGEGTVDAVVAATGGEFLTADVFDPLGSPIRARFGMIGELGGSDSALPGEFGLLAAEVKADGEGQPSEKKVAVIEMAAASGLMLLAPSKRDPLHTTTFGTGQIITAALDAGATEILIGVGGSATMEAGCGCAQALGVSFVDADGTAIQCGIGGGRLADISRIDMSDLDSRIAETTIRVACDVTNPLSGEYGAAYVYGPQKGATEETVEVLDAGLRHFASVVRKQLEIDVESVSGAGAAGGLAGGLIAFTGAGLESGVDIVADVVGLDKRLRGADLCISGEGKFDSQSSSGKAVNGVLKRATRAGVPVVCIPGQVSADADTSGLAGVYPLVSGDVSAEQAMQQTKQLLKQRAIEAVEMFLKNNK